MRSISMPTPPSLITKAQLSPSSVDLNIPLWQLARSPAFDSTIFPPGASCSCFQDFPLLVDLKRPLSEPMKIVPPAVSKTLSIRFSWKFVNTGDHTPVPFVFWKIPPPQLLNANIPVLPAAMLLCSSGKISFFQKETLEFGLL